MKDIGTWGGEHDHRSEYGLRMGDVDIHDISPEEFCNLACEIVNHLMVNGHRFEIVKDEMGVQFFRRII